MYFFSVNLLFFRVNPSSFSVHFHLFRVNSTSFRVNSTCFSVHFHLFRVNPMSFRVNFHSFSVKPTSFRVNPSSFRVNLHFFSVNSTSFRVNSANFSVNSTNFNINVFACTQKSTDRGQCLHYSFHNLVLILRFALQKCMYNLLVALLISLCEVSLQRKWFICFFDFLNRSRQCISCFIKQTDLIQCQSFLNEQSIQ